MNMDHQALYYSISVGTNILLAIFAHQLWVRMRRLVKENELMSEYIGQIHGAFDDAREKARAEREEQMREPPPLPTQHQVTIDHQTFLLMHLATNNSNDDEARSAAIAACTRIMRPTTIMLKP